MKFNCEAFHGGTQRLHPLSSILSHTNSHLPSVSTPTDLTNPPSPVSLLATVHDSPLPFPEFVSCSQKPISLLWRSSRYVRKYFQWDPFLPRGKRVGKGFNACEGFGYGSDFRSHAICNRFRCGYAPKYGMLTRGVHSPLRPGTGGCLSLVQKADWGGIGSFTDFCEDHETVAYALSTRSVRVKSELGCSNEMGLRNDANHSSDYSVFEFEVPLGMKKTRLDSFLADNMAEISRARVQACIRSGTVFVDGEKVTKTSYSVKSGQRIECFVSRPPPLEASPEAIPLDVVYEDDYLIVVNKPVHLVVHPGVGNRTGTLVNALLHHCNIPTITYNSSISNIGLSNTNSQHHCKEARYHSNHQREERNQRDSALESSLSDASDGIPNSEDKDNCSKKDGAVNKEIEREDECEYEREDVDEEDELVSFPVFSESSPTIRPGIVHRLDKGTSGLLVIAKDEYTHMCLSDQFKNRQVKRIYLSLTHGSPSLDFGRIDAAIGRDLKNRKRMKAFTSDFHNLRSKPAASKFRVLERLARDSSALVEWRLETGRTHQIRVHAKHMGNPLLGDDMYGKPDVAYFLSRFPSVFSSRIRQLGLEICRPLLHAHTLGFYHPRLNKEMHFKIDPPQDFLTVLNSLRQLS